jgi:peptide/nickel transport system permease protein
MTTTTTSKPTASLTKTSIKRSRLLRQRSFVLGILMIGTMALCALLAPLISPHDPVEQNFESTLQGPTAQFLLGTDMFGRDQLSRIIYGARISFMVGLISVGIALVAGGLLGLLAAYARGWLDNLIMRLMDVLLAFPFLLLTIAIMASFGTNLVNAMIAIGIVYTPSFARITRAATLGVMEQGFIEASQALGSSPMRLMLRHVLPNITGPLIVQTTLSLAFAILAEAALSFLGLGTQPPTPSWGLMLNEGRSFFNTAPWLAIFPGVAITLAVLGFNLLGDGLRDALDPRLRD